MVHALTWLVIIEALGALAFPLTFRLFHRLPDRGYTLTKPVALVLGAYSLWMLGLTHLVPNSLVTLLGILALGALVSGKLLHHQRGELRAFLAAEWRTLLVAEGVFLAFFLCWLSLIAEFPAINHTEKPMDFAFLNALLQTRFFPPEDPWLAGHPISYYYFGHLMMALLTRLTLTPSPVGYNLALALVPALVATGAFGLLYNLVRRSGASWRAAAGFGLLAPALIILIGNLEGGLELLHARGWGGDGFWQWVGVKGLEGGNFSSSGIFPDQTWWWWRATRVIDTLSGGQSLDYTITEFPFFSFLLGDLHPHVMSLPFLLLVLSLGLNIWLTEDPLGPGWLYRHPVRAVAVALFLGALAFINTWDFPVYTVILGLVFLLKAYRDAGGPSPPVEGGPVATLGRATRAAFLTLVPLVALAVILYLPFYRDLSSQASGILPVGVGTRPFLFFLVMGLPAVLGASFLLRQVPGLSRPQPEDAPVMVFTLIAVLTPFLLWAALTLVLTSITDGPAQALGRVLTRLVWLAPGLAVVGPAGFSAAQRTRLDRCPLLGFPLVLLLVSGYLLVGADLFYVVDFFGNRMNTVFKVYYQSWLLLGIVGTYGLYYWRSRPPARHRAGRIGRHLWTGAVVALVLVSLYYPVGAALDRAGFLSRSHTLADNTLDGLAYLRHTDPGEYAALEWLREQAPPGRIVEAVGEDYSDHGRVSASTGRPTVLGWPGHEHQWRGTTAIFQDRAAEVAEIYQSDNPARVAELLTRYNIRYVYVGRREQARYGDPPLAEFNGLLRTAFSGEGVVIYEFSTGSQNGTGNG